jgi:O-acetyl-ADP-ribose deacetylase (regulator of RNase III)
MSVADRLEAIEADITTLALDAIVNAANEPLIMGGGVDGAIRRKAGREMEEEIRRIGRCATGNAVITHGHRLPARFVIHTVAPVWGGGGATPEQKQALLAACYRNALARADENAIASVAFPCIGTGIYGWPQDLAARIAFETVLQHLRNCEVQTRIVFCCFSREDYGHYSSLISSAGHATGHDLCPRHGAPPGC